MSETRTTLCRLEDDSVPHLLATVAQIERDPGRACTR